MEDEALREIRRAIDDAKYPGRREQFRQRFHEYFRQRDERHRRAPRARPAASASIDGPATAGLVKVTGHVPREFFRWLGNQTGRTEGEQAMLSQCYFEEVSK